MDETTPWQDLIEALEFDHATAVMNAMLALVRRGETAEDIERFLTREGWVHA